MSKAKLKFEVYERTDGRWTMAFIATDEDKAVLDAQARFNLGQIEAIKVVRERIMPSGIVGTVTVLELSKEDGDDGPTQLSGSVEETEVCADPFDMARHEARRLINILYRDWLDDAMLTPMEALHATGHLRRLDNEGSLIQQGLGVAAVAQKNRHGGDINDRKLALTELFEAWQALLKEVERDDEKLLKDLAPGGLPDYAADLASRGLPEGRRLMILGVAAGHALRKAGGWEGKLSEALKLIEGHAGAPPVDAIRTVDRLVSDVLSGGQAIGELLGRQPSLGEALLVLAKIVSGTFQAPAYMPESLTRLSTLIAEHGLKGASAALTRRVAKELESPRLLTKDDSAKEVEVLGELVDLLSDADGNLIGPEITAAVDERSRSQVEPEIRRIYQSTSDCRPRILKLLQLADKVHGHKAREIIVRNVHDMVAFPGNIEKITKDAKNTIDEMRALAVIQRKVDSYALASAEAEALSKLLDQTVFEMMTGASLLANLEAQEPDTVGKARRLLLLARSGAVTAGKAHDAMRKRILNHTQQQGFLQAYTDVAETPEQKEAMLRDFRKLLSDAKVV